MLYRDIIMVTHESLEYLVKQPLCFIEQFHSSLAEIYSEQAKGSGIRYPDAENSQTFTTGHNQQMTRTSKTINFGTILDNMEKRKEAGQYISSLKRQMKGTR